MSEYFTKNIPLIEKIVTWQGEGPNCGKRMNLIRYKRCNRHCSFCDTWTKMSDMKEQLYSIADIDSSLKDIKNIMITGGEPLMTFKIEGIKNNFDSTVDILTACGFEYADIETNGSQNLVKFIDECRKIVDIDVYKAHDRNDKKINISWSPKFDCATDIDKYITLCNDISNYYAQAESAYHNIIIPTMKLVIASDIEKEFVCKIINDGIYDRNNIYLMPLGYSYDEIQKSFPSVVELASQLNCHVSSRLHLVHNFE